MLKKHEKEVEEYKRFRTEAKRIAKNNILRVYDNFKKNKIKVEDFNQVLINVFSYSAFKDGLELQDSLTKEKYNELYNYANLSTYLIKKEENKKIRNYYNNTGFLKKITEVKGKEIRVKNDSLKLYYIENSYKKEINSSFNGYIKDWKIYNSNNIIIGELQENDKDYTISFAKFDVIVSKNTQKIGTLGSFKNNTSFYSAYIKSTDAKDITFRDAMMNQKMKYFGPTYIFFDSKCDECAFGAVIEVLKNYKLVKF
jgi:hypothetical protein